MCAPFEFGGSAFSRSKHIDSEQEKTTNSCSVHRKKKAAPRERSLACCTFAPSYLMWPALVAATNSTCEILAVLFGVDLRHVLAPHCNNRGLQLSRYEQDRFALRLMFAKEWRHDPLRRLQANPCF